MRGLEGMWRVKMGCISTPMPNHLSTLKPRKEVWRTRPEGPGRRRAVWVRIEEKKKNNTKEIYKNRLGEKDMLKRKFEPFDHKVWLASPTMHGEELKYITEAYETNWMSTVGENINEVERIAAEKAEVNYAVGLSCCTAALHLCCKLAGERLYGKPAISHGALEGKRVIAV